MTWTGSHQSGAPTTDPGFGRRPGSVSGVEVGVGNVSECATPTRADLSKDWPSGSIGSTGSIGSSGCSGSCQVAGVVKSRGVGRRVTPRRFKYARKAESRTR